MRLPSCVLLVTLLVVVGNPVDAQSENEDQILRKVSIFITKGNSALKIGNLRKAEAQYSKALRNLPDLPEGHLGMGHVFMRRRMFAKALSAYLAAESCYADASANLLDYYQQRYYDAQVGAADLKRRTLMMGLNVERFEMIMDSGPGSARQREKLRAVQEDLRRSEETVRLLESIEKPPDEAKSGVPGVVYFFIGNALLHLNRIEEAVAAWESCATAEPSFPLVQNNLAVAYWKLGHLESAMTSLENAEALGFEVNPEFRADLERSMGDEGR